MRSLSFRLLLSFLTLVCVPAAYAHDITVSGTTSFAALDGSSSDHDGVANGVFTVNDGNLVVNGVINCNDDSSTSACPMSFNVSGDLTVNNGGALYAENRSGSGIGGAITLVVGGDLALNGNAIVSTASKSSSGSTGGAITATVGGNVTLASGSTIDSGSANAAGGAILIASSGTVAADGNILSGPSRTLLATRLSGGAALDGGTSNTVGGSITITSNTFAEPAMSVGSTANIISQGADGGAGPITLDGCGIQVRGLIAALSKKDGVAKVSIRSGKDVLIDGRDLGGSGTRMGRVRADAPTGTAINKGVDIFATETIDVFGPASGLFVITSLPGIHDSKSYGGLIRIMSLADAVNASGKVIDDGHTASGDTGGTVEISAKEDVNLDTAVIRAYGDFNTGNNNRGGGSISVRSYSGDVIWTNGSGDVRPVGSSSGLPLADQGKIVLTACGTVNTTGSSFPVNGTATSMFPQTSIGVCSPAAPSLPTGVPPLVTCNTPPVANDASATTNEDTTVTITLSGTDADGDPLTFSIVSGPSNGTLGPIIPTGPTTATVDYTPNLNYNGSDSFVYQANDGNGGTDNATVTITINPVNDPPSFLAGPTVTVLEDSGAQTYLNWASSISAGPADESGQTVTFTVTNDNNALFSVQPSVDSAGTLTFTPAANAFGSANIIITAQDNGGTANGGIDTSAPQSSSITVTPVNDEPSFTAGGNVSVNEDSGAYSAAWASAISAGPANESGQSVSFNVSNDNNALFASQPAISPTGVLTFTPAANANGSATVTVFLQDDGGTANGGDDTSASVNFTISVGAVNDAPSFVSGGDVNVLEDSGAYSAAWATSISAGPADESGQTVTFATSNDNNALFSAQPSIDANGNLAFTPAADANGSATVTVTLSDNGGTANGGADTSAPQTFTITVGAVNDEPSFTAGGNVTVNEDSGAYSAAWASAISAGPANESGQTLTFNVSNDNNALFSAQPSIDASGNLTFTPAANANGTATVTVYLQDDGGTANGGDDTSPSVTFTITVTAVNDAPSFVSGGDVSVLEDSGAYSAAWATSISAGPADEAGQNVTFNVTGNSNPSLFASGPTISSTGVLSFTLNADAFGSATITVTLSDDGGTANGGADTSAPQSFTITVNAVNDAPSFTGSGNVSVNEDSGAYSAVWATAISAGPNEGGQTVAFFTSNDNNALFSVQPTINAAGVLSFTPAPNAFGSATVSVYAQDNGGTANGGVDTSATVTFTITVISVNDPPVAANDSWETEGNTELRVDIGASATPHVADTTPSTSGVIDNDADPVEGSPISIVGVVGCADVTAPYDCAVTGGTVSLNSNGSFQFLPNPGVTSGSFQYTISDGSDTANGTVSITIHDMIWYVNGSAPAGGNGTSTSPFSDFASLNGVGDVDGTGDYIFVHNSNVSGSITLEASQKLWGEGVGLIIPRNLNSNGGPTTLVPAGTRPTVTAIAGDVVLVSNVAGVEIAGLNLNTTSGNAIDVTSSSAATSASIYSNVISATGSQGIDINANSAVGTTVAINTTDIVAMGDGVNLSATDGDVIFSYTNGSVTSMAGSGLSLNGGTADRFVINGLGNVTIGAGTAQHGISVTGAIFDANAGTASFDTINGGAWTVATSASPVGGNAVSLSSVSGDVALTSLSAHGTTGGVSIAGSGLFTGVAGMRVTSGGGAVSATAGVGVSVTNTTIGAANLSFTSVSATGGANGILLNNTGSAGGLKVLGTGAANSGGVIHSVPTGVSLTSTAATSLAYMHLHDFTDFAIRGTTVNGFAMSNMTINGVNGDNASADEGSVSFSGLTGSASIASSSISGSVESNLTVINSSGTLNRLTISNTTFGPVAAATGDDGVLIEGQSSAVVNVTVQNSFFTSARGDHFQLNLTGNAASDLVFSGNTITNNHPSVVSGGGGIRVTGGGAGSNVTGTFDISNNNMRDSLGTALGITKGAGAGSFSGTVHNNVIGVAGIADSGSAQGSGISVVHAEGGTTTVSITNNQVYQYGNFGIFTQTGGSAVIGTGTLKATVTGNTVANPGSLAFIKNGFHLNAGTLPGDTYQICLTLGGAGALANNITGSGDDGGTDFRLRQRQSTTVRLPGYAGANNDNAAVVSFVQSNNGGTPTGNVANTVPTGGGYIGGICP